MPLLAFLTVLFGGFAINSENTGGVASAQEAYQDIKAGIEQGYSKPAFTTFELND
ncbi:MAG: hypothetical protein WBK55_08300 [Alphaproteobacteria bacterium]